MRGQLVDFKRDKGSGTDDRQPFRPSLLEGKPDAFGQEKRGVGKGQSVDPGQRFSVEETCFCQECGGVLSLGVNPELVQQVSECRGYIVVQVAEEPKAQDQERERFDELESGDDPERAVGRMEALVETVSPVRSPAMKNRRRRARWLSGSYLRDALRTLARCRLDNSWLFENPAVARLFIDDLLWSRSPSAE